MKTCPNCGAEKVDKYCARCGQRYHAAHSMRQFARDVADDQFGVDSKLPRTLKALFFKPGFLTREYMDGRIARYIPPFRLYLIASVLFFVLLSFLSRQSDWAERAAAEIHAETDSAGIAPRDTVQSRKLKLNLTVGDEKWFENPELDIGWSWLDQRLERNLKALGELPADVAMRRVTDAILEELPKVMFIMLPVYALLLKLLYIRRKRYLVEHFVFALHVHAFVFSLFCLWLFVRNDLLMTLLMAVFALYAFIAMKRVYQQGYTKTFVKWLALGFSYTFVLGFGLVFAIVWALAEAG